MPSSAEQAWQLLIDVRRWPDWGPTVRRATLDDGGHLIGMGSTGRVTTSVGPSIRFEVVDFVDGQHWSWNVATLPATSHEVDRVDDASCVVTFGVPWPAAAYLIVCRRALDRIARIVVAGDV